MSHAVASSVTPALVVIVVAILLCVNVVPVFARDASSSSNCTTLWAAGWNLYGAFGDGPDSIDPFGTNKVTTPSVVGTFEDGLHLRDVSAGWGHSALVKSDGSVWTAGLGNLGQLGHNATINVPTFTRVDGIAGNVAKAVAGGNGNTFFILEDGGEVYATGNNWAGQLGVGDTDIRLSPVKVPIENVVDVATGRGHTLFLKADGTVYAAGFNFFGQLGLGLGMQEQATVPVPITTLLSPVTQIAAGVLHSVFLTETGEVWTCGNNARGQLGLGDNDDRNVPSRVGGLAGVTSVVASSSSTAFLLSDGALHSTGWNLHGQLGVGDHVDRSAPVAVSAGVVDATGVADLYGSSGNYFFFVRSVEGALWGTGDNEHGQLGIGAGSNTTIPVEVATLSSEDGVSLVTGGEDFTLFCRQ